MDNSFDSLLNASAVPQDEKGTGIYCGKQK